MTSQVRIVLIGDRHVGKTSLITSLMKEKFEEEVVPVLSELTIPASAMPEPVTTHIVDTSLRIQDEEAIMAQIREADVIGLVYSLASPETMERLQSYWMPLVRRSVQNDTKPVIVIGNKSDLSKTGPASQSERLRKYIEPLMTTYIEVETSIECSAKALTGISEAFRYAQKAILYPIAAIYHPQRYELTPAAKKAIARIFFICDTDRDGLLSEAELNSFQATVFGQPLSQAELASIINIVQSSLPQGVEDDALTLEGFEAVLKLFVERGRLETTWQVLRRFGYQNDLTLLPAYIRPELEVCEDAIAEPSEQAINFLTQLFNQHDEEGRDFLDKNQLDHVFAPTPGMPWANDILVEAPDASMSLSNFLALWRYLCYVDVGLFMEYMAYLGFTLCSRQLEPNVDGDSVLQAVKVSRSRRDERAAGVCNRDLFICRLIGRRESGKVC
ncbi:uncharacterized protein MONBRDRAFT_15914 [Monosiga brevicollis MX1]|uniref:Miro domain-containing protein n=1 Tax=Monosiga brevicollis TaxID=81824 RepID=A9UVP4_MONBE|nr:uncharacterized protein MONBRDRAFT_15914 [Monosiga brevicollis MX1]EDQ90620.1 predicted protein [Monosiga brevicollis MX1]|eukprot:XP_001744671.1 hypothetical protein [Monosiga brevicollis MX1]